MERIELNIPDIHVGNLLSDYLKSINRPQAYLAKMLNMASTNLSKLLKKKSIETEKLFDISMKLEHNFFAVFGNDLNLMDAGTYKITMPELGLLIEKRMKDLKMTQIEFATAIGIARSDVNRILRKISFDTDKLRIISEALNHNFFKDFYSAKDIPISKEQMDERHMASLVQRLEELAIENDRLKHDLQSSVEENDRLKKIITDAGLKFN